MPFVKIRDQEIPFQLRRSSKARNLHLSARDKIEIVAPWSVSNTEALRFLWKHQLWMYRQHLQIQQKQTLSNPFRWPAQYVDGASLPFRGERLVLKIGVAAKAQVIQQDTQLLVNLSLRTKPEDQQTAMKKLINRWLIEQTQQHVALILNHYCPSLDRWPSRVAIKKLRSRWGSCGSTDQININWVLILAPPQMLEYVVVHELCHLFHRNHGKRFWAKVAKCMPDYAKCDRWLNQMSYFLGSSLHMTQPVVSCEDLTPSL